MASEWQKSLRRSDVGPGLPPGDKRNGAFARPRAGPRKSTGGAVAKVTEKKPAVLVTAPSDLTSGVTRKEVGPGLPPGDKGKGAFARPRAGVLGGAVAKGVEKHPAVLVTAPSDLTSGVTRKVSKLSVVNEEDAIDVAKDGVDDNGEVFEGMENRSAKPRRPSRSRKSTLGSVGSGRSDVSKSAADGTSKNNLAPNAPSKKASLLSPLPKTPDLVSPLTLSRIALPPSPMPLPKGVKCIDTDDGSEWSYAPHIIQYSKQEEEVYTQSANYTDWTLKPLSKYKSLKTRETVMDWIIEVLHYFSGSQEALYNTVHLIDRYVISTGGNLNHDKIQLVGVAAVLLATKLEEYHPANVEELSRLTEGSCSKDTIKKMEMKMLQALSFQTYSLDPMLFLNRFIVAAQRENEPIFKEACQFFLDSFIAKKWQWAVQTSAKCAAAVLTTLVLMPNTANPIGAEEELWTPTLQFYTEFKISDIVSISQQMITNLWEVKSTKTKQVVAGLTAKYISKSKHMQFLKTEHCSKENIERTLLIIRDDMQ